MPRAADERQVSTAGFGMGPLGGEVLLTERRIIVAEGEAEESIPLGAITSVRTGFARDVAAAFWGGVILVLALGFASAYRPLETAINTAGLAIEKRMNDKLPDGEAYGRYLYLPLGLVWGVMLPLIGWGAFRLVSGVQGETELVIATAGGELRRTARGRSAELIGFGADVGRMLGR